QFVSNLLKKNPVTVYRFGARLDDDPGAITTEAAWARADWDSFVKYDFKPLALKGLTPEGQERVKKATAWNGDDPGTADWAIGWAKASETDSGMDQLNEADQEVLRTNRTKIEKRIDVARAIVQGTAMPDSITAAVNREDTTEFSGLAVKHMAGRSMRHHAGQLVLAGRTTLSEAVRISSELED
ncbi:MAG: hypothetical protein Q8K27_03245, partial [Betaproteobacteria bacterium]|nr:hypothetical protein [Betaproteobacteria bacterium]